MQLHSLSMQWYTNIFLFFSYLLPPYIAHSIRVILKIATSWLLQCFLASFLDSEMYNFIDSLQSHRLESAGKL